MADDRPSPLRTLNGFLLVCGLLALAFYYLWRACR